MSTTINLDGENIPERRAGIVFSKEISLGSVLTMLGMLVSVVIGYGKLDTRLTVLEAAQISNERVAAQDVTSRNNFQNEMKQDMREIRQDIKSIATKPPTAITLSK